ncbi:hypothetical protein BHM03_00050675, partial [Ensete ventricosum]
FHVVDGEFDIAIPVFFGGVERRGPEGSKELCVYGFGDVGKSSTEIDENLEPGGDVIVHDRTASSWI